MHASDRRKIGLKTRCIFSIDARLMFNSASCSFIFFSFLSVGQCNTKSKSHVIAKPFGSVLLIQIRTVL